MKTLELSSRKTRIAVESPSSVIAVRSVGIVPVQISRIRVGAGFTQINNCPRTLPILVTFAPTKIKVYAVKLKLVTANAGTPFVPLTGTGVAQ